MTYWLNSRLSGRSCKRDDFKLISIFSHNGAACLSCSALHASCSRYTFYLHLLLLLLSSSVFGPYSCLIIPLSSLLSEPAFTAARCSRSEGGLRAMLLYILRRA